MNRVVLVSNRLPELGVHEHGGAPGIPAGGLASAVFAALRGTSGNVWFGWNGKAASDGAWTNAVEVDALGLRLIGMPLTRNEVELYYYGFANSALWPLFHCFAGRVELDVEQERCYRRVQRRFAEALARLLEPDDVVWVNDYHLLLLARELRQLGWRGPTGFFLHIPFPPRDLFRVLPDPRGFLEALLDFDLVGFHVQGFLDNYLHACAAELGARVDGGELVWNGRRQRTGVFPVGIDPTLFVPSGDDGEKAPEDGRSLTRAVRGRKIVLGVDRLDYTKGIPERLLSFGEFLVTQPQWRQRVSMVQIAAPSRTRVHTYVEHKQRIDELVGRINGELAEHDWVPIRYLYRSYGREALAGFYRDADVGLVTPLRDGMNLVAKEFVAAQDPRQPGVLVLSRFAGAAEELPEAVMVNPYLTSDTAQAILRALEMPLEERRERHAALLARVLRGTADDWARTFLAELRTTRRVSAVSPSRTKRSSRAALE